MAVGSRYLPSEIPENILVYNNENKNHHKLVNIRLNELLQLLHRQICEKFGLYIANLLKRLQHAHSYDCCKIFY